MSTTLSALLSGLSTHPDHPLVFHAEGERIRPEYHVTEVKLAQVRGLDCGKGASTWHETIVQLLDGPAIESEGAEYMTVDKFSQIAGAGLAALEEAASGNLLFEFAPGNGAVRRLSVDRVSHEDGHWQVDLGPSAAACKPALRAMAENSGNQSNCCSAKTQSADAPCCAPSADGTACCAT